MLTAYTTLPTLEPTPRDVVILSIGAPAVVALVLLAFVVVCVRLAQQKRSTHRGLHIVRRSRLRPKVRRAA
jgi:hypothetical protein